MEYQVREDVRLLTLSGHVGFDSLPRQLIRKALARGFSFNILCVGETGIGKSTLMNTLFNTVFETDECGHFEGRVRLLPRTYSLQECNVRLRLTIVDAAGFGDQLDRDCGPVVDYVDEQLEGYLQEELKIQRRLWDYRDTRVHACIYFLTPTVHALKAVDLETMKRLHAKVNVIPVIAKADTLTRDELPRFKSRVLSELARHGVRIYQCPTDDEAVAEANADLNARLPFAVVGSTERVPLGGLLVRGRSYPWGVVQVDDHSHCDSGRLRELLIGVNMEDLREQTHQCHYERYRRQKLEGLGFQDDAGHEALRREQAAEMRRQERLLRQELTSRAREVEAQVKEKERELSERFEELKRILQEEKGKVEEKRRQLEEDKNAFNYHRAAVEAMRAMQEQAMQEQAMQEQAMQAQAMQEQAMQEQAMQAQAMQEQAMQEQAMRAIQEQAMRAQAIQEQAMRAQAMQEQAMRAQTLQAQVMHAQAMRAAPQQSTPKKDKGKDRKQ
ncbi:septin-8-like [Petaurus breviceps papuanus]|uniref:septin-8-like n=1 Tax=Petaurus breviceps papuanus TaxID=3040969 RepID=UPI0036D8DB9B